MAIHFEVHKACHLVEKKYLINVEKIITKTQKDTKEKYKSFETRTKRLFLEVSALK
jgi:hypothetical protein